MTARVLNKEEQDRRLKAFATEMWETTCDGTHFDCCELQDLFIKHKLVKKGFASAEWTEEYGSQFWYTLHKWIKEPQDTL